MKGSEFCDKNNTGLTDGFSYFCRKNPSMMDGKITNFVSRLFSHRIKFHVFMAKLSIKRCVNGWLTPLLF